MFTTITVALITAVVGPIIVNWVKLPFPRKNKTRGHDLSLDMGLDLKQPP